MDDPRIPGVLWVEGPAGAFVGSAPSSSPHRVHTLQLIVGLDGPLVLSVPGWGRDVDVDAVALPPGVEHAWRSAGPVATFFYQPEKPEALGPSRGLRRACAHVVDASTRMLVRDALQGSRRYDRGRVAGLAADSLRALSREVGCRSRLDPRIEGILGRLWDGDDESRLEDLARSVSLSSTRLTHLFQREVGLSLRSYRSWITLRRAVDRISTSKAASSPTLTEIAHAAGFADSAHFSRSFRRAFGVAPSSLAPRPLAP